jgi:hypothetical protein
MNDQAVFGRSSHARCGGCRGGGELPRGGTTVQHQREQRGAAREAVSADGRVAAKPMGGERNARLKDERDWLLARVAASPDLPLHAIQRELGPRAMSTTAMARSDAFSPRRRSPLKETVYAAEQDWPDIAAERMRRQQSQKQLDLKRLVLIDETWAILRQAQDQHGPHTWTMPARRTASR